MTDLKKWEAILHDLKKIHGCIDGIIHAAGKVGKALDFIDNINVESIDKNIGAKIDGAFGINKVLMDFQLDFCI